MTFDLHIRLDEKSPEAIALAAIMSREGISPEQAVRNLLKLSLDTDNYDHLFTPDVISDLHSIAAGIRAGAKTFSMDEVDEFFSKKRQA